LSCFYFFNIPRGEKYPNPSGVGGKSDQVMPSTNTRTKVTKRQHQNQFQLSWPLGRQKVQENPPQRADPPFGSLETLGLMKSMHRDEEVRKLE
jgi:hypothetical protein